MIAIHRIQHSPPSLSLLRNGVATPIDPAFQLSSLNDTVLNELFSAENSQYVQPFYCQSRTTPSTFYERIAVNQTSVGSIHLSGLACVASSLYAWYSADLRHFG